MGPMTPQQQSMMSPHHPHQQQMVAQQQQHQAAVAAAQQAAQAAAQQAQQQGHQGQGPPQQQPNPGNQPQGPPQGLPPSSQQDQARVDNISKAKTLIPNLRESMLNVMRNAALAISANNMIDSGTKQVDYDVSRFDKSFEEFFFYVDQLEVQLRTSIECLNQNNQSAKYLPVPITSSKTESSMTYPEFINLVKGQIAYAKDIHGALSDASQRLSD